MLQQQANQAWTKPVYAPYRTTGLAAVQVGDYPRAIDRYQAGERVAFAAGDTAVAGRFLTNIGGSYSASGRHGQALNALLEARRLASDSGDLQMVNTVQLSLANLHLQMGDLDSAALAASEGVSAVKRSNLYGSSIPLLLLLARVTARTGNREQGFSYQRDAIMLAQLTGSQAWEADAWDEYGNELMAAGRLPQAEASLAQALRIRTLRKDWRLGLSFHKFARLKLLERDYESAGRWLVKAYASARRSGAAVPPWDLHYLRGLIAEGQHRDRDALADFRQSIETAREWRLDTLPADQSRIGVETKLQDLYDAYLRMAAAAMRRESTGDLVRESLLMLDDNHAWSTRQLQMAAAKQTLPAEYFRLIEQVRQSPGKNTGQLSLRLLEMEAAAGLRSATSRRETNHANLPRPRANTATLVYHLSEPESQLWLLTPEGVAHTTLPPKAEIEGAVRHFVESVRTETRQALLPESQELLRTLTGRLRNAALKYRDWNLLLEGDLYALPFAALADDKFLIERHTLRTVPNLAPASAPGIASGPLLAAGDAIYNRADERLNTSRPGWFSLPAARAAEHAELPRLPESAAEIRRVAALWSGSGGASTVLTGAEITVDGLARAVATLHPAIIHIAAHTLESGPARESVQLALSLGANGNLGMLGAEAIAAMRTNAELVVLNACRTGTGKRSRAGSLLDLSRAWIAAGARNVIVSHWPVGGDSGILFEQLYRELRPGSQLAPAEALRRAQIASLHSGGARAEPAYWSAFFVSGKADVR